jgi:hypothetical protein
MKNIYLLLFSTVFLYSCASTKLEDQERATMQSWVGHNKSELIGTWGPPQKVSTDGQGGEIYIYDTTMNFGQSSGQVYSQNNKIYYTNPQSRVVTRSRMFYINKSGVIYSWLCQGRQGN